MKTVLFVCTGNTCRSPMAEGLLRKEMKQRGINENQVQVMSAGIFAQNGEPATEHAVTVMRERGVSLKSHRSRRLNHAMLEKADLILTMTTDHKQALLMMDAAVAERLFTIAEFVSDPETAGITDVADPFGGSPDMYRTTAEQLERMVKALAQELAKADKTEEQP